MLSRFIGCVHLMALFMVSLSFNAHGRINLSVYLQDDLDSSEVTVSGTEVFPYSDEVAKVFGVPRQVVGEIKLLPNIAKPEYNNLRKVLKNWWGRVPDEFVTSDPVIGSSVKNVPHEWTPYTDSWGVENQVVVTRKAVGATIVALSGNIDSIATSKIENLSKREQQGQEIELAYTEEVEDSRFSEKSWTRSLTNGFEISVGGEFKGFSAGVTRSVEFTVERSKTQGESRTITKGRTIRLKANVDAAPETVYPVSVLVGRGSLSIKIDYEYSITGFWRGLYLYKAYNGKLAAPLSSVEELLRALGKPTHFKDSEILEVGFITDGAISIGEGIPVYDELIADALERTITKREEYIARGIEKGVARLERVINTLKGKIEMYGEEAEVHLGNVKKTGDKKTIVMWEKIIDAFDEIGVPWEENEERSQDTTVDIHGDIVDENCTEKLATEIILPLESEYLKMNLNAILCPLTTKN